MADFSVGILGLNTLGSALIRRLDGDGHRQYRDRPSIRGCCRRILPAAAAHRPGSPYDPHKSAT